MATKKKAAGRPRSTRLAAKRAKVTKSTTTRQPKKAAKKSPSSKVTIMLGPNLKMQLEKDTLTKCSSYFATFANLPKKFALKAASPEGQCRVPGSIVDADGDPEGKITKNFAAKMRHNSDLKRCQLAHKTVFQLLGDRKLTDISSPVLFEASFIADGYLGCFDEIKDKLRAALRTVHLDVKYVARNAGDVFAIANKLKLEGAYKESFRTVGHCPADQIPDELKRYAKISRKEMKEAIRNCCADVLRHHRPAYADLPDMLASGMTYERLSPKLAEAYRDPLCESVYNFLSELYCVTNVSEFVNPNTMIEIGKNYDCLEIGRDAIEEWRENTDDDPAPGKQEQIEEAIDRAATEKRVEERIWNMMHQIGKDVAPLFDGDVGVGFFSFVKHSGLCPWQE